MVQTTCGLYSKALGLIIACYSLFHYDPGCYHQFLNFHVQAVLCFTPDANHSLDGNRTKTTNMKCNVSQVGHPHDQDHEETEYNFRQRHTQRILDSFETGTKVAIFCCCLCSVEKWSF